MDTSIPPPTAATAPTVLLCLADPVFRDAIAATARALGHTVVPDTQQGERVVALVAALTPDAVVVDLSMTGVGGFSTIVNLCRLVPTTTVVVSCDLPVARRPLLAAGAAHVVDEGDVAAVRVALASVAGRSGTESTNVPAS